MFVLNQNRIDCEKIVYLNKNGKQVSSLSDNEEELTENNNNNHRTDNQNIINTDVVRRFNNSENDLSLSEDEDVDQQQKSSDTHRMDVKKPAHVSAQQTPKLVYLNQPTLIEKFFNLYDNSARDLLVYILDNQFTIVPYTFLLYIIRNRQKKNNLLKLASTNNQKTLWLCYTLDLEYNISNIK